MKTQSLVLTLLALSPPSVLLAQEAEDRTLLTQEEMTAIINEVSGERAMHHVLELVPYQRVRSPEEYSGPFRESRVMAEFAEAYGFSNVSLEVFREGGTAWQPTRGELWMTSPRSVKLLAYELQGDLRGVPAIEVELSAAQREAANLVVEQVPRAGGGRGGFRGGGGPSLPDEFNAEFSLLLGRGMTVLEMRDFLSGEFTPLPLEDLMAVLRAREEAGSVRLPRQPSARCPNCASSMSSAGISSPARSSCCTASPAELSSSTCSVTNH